MLCACGKPAGRDGKCGGCRLSAFARGNIRYNWTPELLKQMVRIYSLKMSKCGRELSRLARDTGIPKKTLMFKAHRMGITHPLRRWTAEEDRYLREAAGHVSVRAMARKLKRGPDSVRNHIASLELVARLRDGYNIEDLRACFGAEYRTVRNWLDRGLLHAHRGAARDGGYRISDASVRKFLASHPHEYSLKRVDEEWFKGMVFDWTHDGDELRREGQLERHHGAA